MTTTTSANESTVRVGENDVQMFSGGSRPRRFYILHETGGNRGWQSLPPGIGPRVIQSMLLHSPDSTALHGRYGFAPSTTWPILFLEMVQQLGLEQYILVGSSMGGWVAAEMAAMGQEKPEGFGVDRRGGDSPPNKER